MVHQYITIRCVSPSDSIVSSSLHVQWGYTPLLRAARKGHAEVARFLLENGSNVQEENNVSRLERMLPACGYYITNFDIAVLYSL